MARPRVTAMDFRLPGSVTMEMLEFTPQPGGEPVTGAVVGSQDLAEGAPAEGSEAAMEEPKEELAPPPQPMPPPSGGGSGTQAASDTVK